MKVSVIGASGKVGSSAAFCLAEEYSLRELVLVSREESLDKIKGEAMDMYDALAAKDVHVDIKSTSNLEDLAGSNIIVLTSGIARKEGMSRMDLAIPNAKIVAKYAKAVAKYAPDSILLVVSNPVDVMTHVALKASGMDKTRVIGLGNHLDSLRLKTFIARHFNINVSEVRSRVIGEHGANMVPLLSSTSIGGILLKYFSNYHDFDMGNIIEKVKSAGEEVIIRKGATEFGPAYAISNIVTTILNDQKRILTVSAYLDGEIEGVKGVCLGVPAKVGAKGIEEIIPIKMSDYEIKAFLKAADVVKSLTDDVFKAADI
ncbi:MAG: malate dehydrogenase [Methanobacteriaceae archaeon]|nr:malate dehydrogenase [Methanobacteriaceae archaeon]MDO9626325.1 malate dehydrogenase [Methanobacteriaceae archaeon]